GCSCCCVACMESVVARCVHVVVAQLALDSLVVIFPMWRMVAGKSRLSSCSVCRVASLVKRCDTCLWLLSAWCWLIVSSSEVLLESFSVGSDGTEVSPELTVPCSFLSVVVLPQGLSVSFGWAAFWCGSPRMALGAFGGGVVPLAVRLAAMLARLPCRSFLSSRLRWWDVVCPRGRVVCFVSRAYVLLHMVV
ncbi:hypothetical protein Taro_017165, partial [Colocasia esculenta]|nr:hypothetical protein [Colocasia esculenta]